MRSIHADLLAAQKSRSYEPYVTAVAYNQIEGVRRLDYTVLDTTSNAGAKHDVAVAADGSVTRIRIDAGALKQQRVTPDASPNWSAWNTPAAGIGTQCACAARGTRVAIIYTDAAGTGLYMRESTNSGASYGGSTLLGAAGTAITDLAIAYKNTSGDMAIAWTEATRLNLVIRTGGSWAGSTMCPTLFGSLNGVALVYGLDWDILITGAENTTTKSTLWSVIYGDGGDALAATWTTPNIQAQADATSGTAFSYPYLTYVDTYRATYLETASYTGGNPRIYRMYMQPSLSFNQGAYTWRAPLPSPLAYTNGLAIAGEPTADYAYESNTALVQRADKRQVTLDLTADLLAVDLDETTRRIRCSIELNNDAGQYAGPPATLAVGNFVALHLGYQTASGPRTTVAPVGLWVADVVHRRAGGRSTLRLELESGWERLRRSSQRTSVIHTTSHYRAILSAIMARAGLQMTTNGASARAGAIVPQFTIDPQERGYTAAMNALQFIADRLRMDGNSEVRLTEPLIADASTYTYGADHPIFAAELRTAAAPVGQAHAFGAAAYGEQTDYTAAQHGFAPAAHLRDLTSATGAAAAATATAHLRQRALDAHHGTLHVPPNVAQELLDVITYTDGYTANGDIIRRVMGIHWRYDKRRSLYQQELQLGPR